MTLHDIVTECSSQEEAPVCTTIHDHEKVAKYVFDNSSCPFKNCVIVLFLYANGILFCTVLRVLIVCDTHLCCLPSVPSVFLTLICRHKMNRARYSVGVFGSTVLALF